MRQIFCSAGLSALLVAGCASMRGPAGHDPYLWLEEVYGEKALAWVKEQNAKSSALLKEDPEFKKVADAARAILTAEDRIPYPSIAKDKYRNFWQDEKHVRGVWRETTFAEYRKPQPRWKVLLDIDELNKKENKSWVFKGARCLPPEYELCLIGLSDGGKDAVTVREFDTRKREFVENGFYIPAAKNRYNWIDRNTIFVGTDWGPGTLTTSGYPRQVRIWKRGQPLADATLILNGEATDVSAYAFRSFRPATGNMFVSRAVTFFEEENHLWEDGKLHKIPMPPSAELRGDFNGYVLYLLREDLVTAGKTFVAGSIVALPVESIRAGNALEKLESVFTPEERAVFASLEFGRDYLYIGVLRNVRGELLRVQRVSDGWRAERLPFPTDGMVDVVSADEFSNHYVAEYESFLTPTTLYAADAGEISRSPAVLKKLPSRFKAQGLTVQQYEATSKDGTKVPYYVIHRRNMRRDGNNPTLMYGYGGFENSNTPFYLGVIGKVWLERGGVYVYTNIRGGGEFGPRWHRAALKENRQKAYDDFAAIAEDLFARKITTPRRLGIMGGSNGGLLMGVAATQHPDYYKAVVCKAPLLDMLRYHKLPPGASWIGEYGNPDIPEEAAFIAAYSPYQNVRAGVKYPKIYFYTSTADDRVQPGHARKMAARLMELGNEVVYYENTEGGHGGAADLEQRIIATALDYTYLYQQLMGE